METLVLETITKNEFSMDNQNQSISSPNLNVKDLNLYILDRHSRFAVRLNTLLNAGYFPGEELLLVSNRPHSKTVSGRSSPKS